MGYKYVEKYVEKIPQHFLEEKKTHFFGVGAPTPIFEPYISSYNHIFGQNVTKLHFLYPTKHSGYYYVWFFVKQSPHPFFKEKRTLFDGHYQQQVGIWIYFLWISLNYPSWIKMTFCGILFRNVVLRADLRLKNWHWSSNSKKIGFILL